MRDGEICIKPEDVPGDDTVSSLVFCGRKRLRGRGNLTPRSWMQLFLSYKKKQKAWQSKNTAGMGRDWAQDALASVFFAPPLEGTRQRKPDVDQGTWHTSSFLLWTEVTSRGPFLSRFRDQDSTISFPGWGTSQRAGPSLFPTNELCLFPEYCEAWPVVSQQSRAKGR